MMVPKFRAYIKDLDELDYNDVPHKGHFVYGNLIKGKPNDDVDAIVGDLIEINDEYVNVEFWKSIEKGSAEQYTGLTDVNGRDIYIGDVVKAWSDMRELTMEPTVNEIVSENFFGRPGLFLKPAGPHLFEPCLHDSRSNQFEVIGNVHENPELSEVEN